MENTDALHSLLGSSVAQTRRLGGEATYLLLGDGRELVLKGVPRQDRPTWVPGTPWTELVVLDLLASEGMPVPELVAADLNDGWMLRSYEPGQPLSEIVSPLRHEVWSALVQNLTSLEKTLAAASHELSTFATPSAPAAWASVNENMMGLLAPAGQQAWNELREWVLLPQETTLGLLDINANNAVWNEGRLCFIDFATIGPDFPERRLVSYAQSAWPHPGTLLGPAAYEDYASQFGQRAAVRLALFDLMFWAIVLARLQVMRTRPQSDAAIRLRKVWGDPQKLWEPSLRMWGRHRMTDRRLDEIVGGLQLTGDDGTSFPF